MRKKSIWGVLIIGAVAAVSLAVLFLISPSCAGAGMEDEPAGVDPPPPPGPAEDPFAAEAEAAAAASVAATVAASTVLTSGDVARTVEAVLAARDADAAVEEGRRSRVFARTPLPPGGSGTSGDGEPRSGGSEGFGAVPVFGDDWEGASGPLEPYEDRVSLYRVLRPGSWISYPLERGSRFAEPDGRGWMKVHWHELPGGGTLSGYVAARRASLAAEASGWRVYEFFGESGIAPEGGAAGVRLDYGRVAGGGCAERISEAWYGPLAPEGGAPRVYAVVFAYCAGYAADFGGYAGAALGSFRWTP